MKYILIRKRDSENEIFVDTFISIDIISHPIPNPEQAIRKAISEFLTTDDGKTLKKALPDFNWGDAVCYVPQELWKKHGLKLLDINKNIIIVDEDEVL